MAASNLLYSCPVFKVNRVFLKILAAKSLYLYYYLKQTACRSGYVVPRRKFYSFYVRAAIDRDIMEWTTKFPRSKPCTHLLRYLSLAGFVCGFSVLNQSLDYAGEDEENSV